MHEWSGARVIKPITDVIKDFLTVKRLLCVIKLNLRYNISSYGEITVLQKYWYRDNVIKHVNFCSTAISPYNGNFNMKKKNSVIKLP
jgi:hypothetical protein